VEEYFKEMEMIMMRANIDEDEEQTMARFFNGLTYPIKRIVEFLPYTSLCQLVHHASKAEHQVQEDAKHERYKTFFASRNTSSSLVIPKDAHAISSKAISKPPQAQAPPSTTSSKASATPLKVTCFKCGIQGHKSFECKNTRVMITRDNGIVDYYSEGEYEAFVQAAIAIEEDDMGDEEEHVLCTHDTGPSLVVSKVLTTQTQDL
jgi:hypothetical protein